MVSWPPRVIPTSTTTPLQFNFSCVSRDCLLSAVIWQIHVHTTLGRWERPKSNSNNHTQRNHHTDTHHTQKNVLLSHNPTTERANERTNKLTIRTNQLGKQPNNPTPTSNQPTEPTNARTYEQTTNKRSNNEPTNEQTNERTNHKPTNNKPTNEPTNQRPHSVAVTHSRCPPTLTLTHSHSLTH